MTNDEALKMVKDLIEYSQSSTISELKIDECDFPLAGEGVKTKKITRIEYIIRTIETIVSSDTINAQIEHIDTQISTLETQKDDITLIGEKIIAIQ